jgi:hypothetical protein
MYQCECGTILRNVYPYQLDKHRRSKKHLNCLLLQHSVWDKQREKQPDEPVQIVEEPTPEIANNDPVEITFD